MNSRKVRAAMQMVFERLSVLDPAELRRQIEAHRGGPLSKQLIDSGMFDARVEEAEELLAMSFSSSPETIDSMPYTGTFLIDSLAWGLSGLHTSALGDNFTQITYVGESARFTGALNKDWLATLLGTAAPPRSDRWEVKVISKPEKSDGGSKIDMIPKAA